MILRTICSAALVLLAFAGSTLADETAPAVLANACASCHGIDGKGVANSNMPAINGRPAAQMSMALKGFKADQPTVTIMNRIAKGYTDAEIDALANYFANIR